MQDHEKPEGTWSGSTGSIPNRKRSATSLGANIQQRDDSHNNISAPKPSQSKSQKSPKSTKFQPSEFPYQATGPKPSKQSSLTPNSQSEEQSILGSEPRSSNSRTSSPDPYSRPEPKDPGTDELFNNPRAEIKTKRKWDPKEWNKDEIDSDDEYMSLAVMMKLPHELSLLQEYLETYRSFNDYLGRKHSPYIASGPRHKGLLCNIFSTVDRLESYTAHLRTLREEKQRGNPEPGKMELAVETISDKCRDRSQSVWDLMEEKVDMANDAERRVWVEEKKQVLGDVMDWMSGYLQGLDAGEEGWKEKEVMRMKQAWEERWKRYGEMDIEDQKDAGWILEVGE